MFYTHTHYTASTHFSKKKIILLILKKLHLQRKQIILMIREVSFFKKSQFINGEAIMGLEINYLTNANRFLGSNNQWILKPSGESLMEKLKVEGSSCHHLNPLINAAISKSDSRHACLVL